MHMPFCGTGGQSLGNEGCEAVRRALPLENIDDLSNAIDISRRGENDGIGIIRQTCIGYKPMSREYRTDIALPRAAAPRMKAFAQGTAREALKRHISHCQRMTSLGGRPRKLCDRHTLAAGTEVIR